MSDESQLRVVKSRIALQWWKVFIIQASNLLKSPGKFRDKHEISFGYVGWVSVVCPLHSPSRKNCTPSGPKAGEVTDFFSKVCVGGGGNPTPPEGLGVPMTQNFAHLSFLGEPPPLHPLLHPQKPLPTTQSSKKSVHERWLK